MPESLYKFLFISLVNVLTLYWRVSLGCALEHALGEGEGNSRRKKVEHVLPLGS